MTPPFVAVVTGASSGIGQAIALEFARRGATLIVHGRSNLAGLTQTVHQIRAIQSNQPNQPPVQLSRFENSSVMSIVSDIEDRHSNASLVDVAFQRFGYVDAWIHAAGADVLTGDARNLTFTEKLDRLWATDVRGGMLLSRLVAAKMLSSKICSEQQAAPIRIPSMVHIGWDQSEHGMEGDSGQYFSATKAAITAFSKSLAKSLAPHVRVNCIAPGWVKTQWGQTTHPSWQQRATGESMLNRWGTPEDIARVVAAVSFEDGAFINGQTIAVNGGWQSMTLSAISETKLLD
jgi:3-oxoacyl-[acyl-carrier protein] reductase